MRVLALVSSPRAGGNSELAAKEIMRQLPDSWEKEMIRVNELNLKYCTACYSCIPENKVCKLDDDLAFVLDHVRRADKVIIAEPAYFLGGHTAMKVLMDRLLSILMNYREFEGKECVLVASYGLHKWEGLVKEDMIILAREFNLTIVDSAVLLATLPGDSVTGENLKIVTRLAQSLMKAPAKIEPENGELNCPYCASRTLNLKTDGSWVCTVCGGVGSLENRNGAFSLKYDPSGDYHFTNQGKIMHAAYLDEKRSSSSPPGTG
jgi:multimeric flavodoxin WrbA